MKKFSVVFFLTCIFIASSSVFAQDFECLDCHENLIEGSAHFDAVECSDCHNDVTDFDHVDSGAEKVNCSMCHDDYAELVKRDIHHRLKEKVSNPPNCVRCHGTHQIKSPSDISNKVGEYCSQCHENAILANPYHSVAESNETCYDCHESAEFKPDLLKSVHAQLNCADCHNYVSHNLADHPDNVTKLQKADCYLCHNDIATEHRQSIHGISLLEGVNEAAQCWDCHGSHLIEKVDDPKSLVYPENLAETCGICHNDPEIVKKFDISPIAPVKDYSQSVHGLIVKEGGNAATCSTCHGVHDIKNRVQPSSKISTFNIPNTCSECHKEIAEEYENSIHWVRAKKGTRLAPVCTDCHSEHNIQVINGHGTKQRQDEIRKIQEQTCFQCHQNPMIAKTDGGQVKNYQDSYHGLAAMRGDEDAALCIDCHGVHEILPKIHPESTVNEDNVTETCRKCHEGATEVFSKSYSHKTEDERAATIEDWVESIYFWLIVVVIGGMILHNALIFVDELKAKRSKEKSVIRVPRFTKNEVYQHLLLLTSFILLAITGFALKFPESWWAEGLLWLGLTEPVRQFVHKTSGTLMIALSLYHLIYLMSTPRGREVLIKMIPTVKDVREAVAAVFYYLRISKEKPDFDKYDYTEKAEYWALIWGTIVMGFTGLVLWFPTVVGDWAPVWFIKVCEIVHFYEAILASLAILVWHWFFVIYRPSEYPMSFAWIDGKMTLHNYKHHHKNHFKQVALEILKIKYESMDESKASNYTKLFMETLIKQDLDPFEVIRSQMEEDEELRTWLENKLENNTGS